MILNDVSLEVPQNSVIGITGRSGSGKSTLLKLMMRFWDTDLGKVELSGVNIKKINTASLRSAESFVEQDTVLFHDSIEENLRIANQNATHEQVVGRIFPRNKLRCKAVPSVFLYIFSLLHSCFQIFFTRNPFSDSISSIISSVSSLSASTCWLPQGTL